MYDYVIVGAGSAGCVLANRLSANPANRVALLEAGPPDRNLFIGMPSGMILAMNSKALTWRYKTVPQKHLNNRILDDQRGKTLGGSSSINGMIYCRGAPADYDRWAQEGAPGWSYNEVLPYFKLSECYAPGADEFHGGSGPLRVSRASLNNPISKAWVEAAAQAGFAYNDDINGSRRDGVGPASLTLHGRQRCSSATAYLRAAAKRPNLTVITGVHATKILLQGTRATGVEYVRNGETRSAMAAAEVVLCGGVYQSPQLLMLSGIGNGNDLSGLGITTRIDLKGVGQNLHDHPGYSVQASCPQPVSLAGIANPLNALWAGIQYLLFRSGPLAETMYEATGMLNSGVYPEAHPDIKLILVLLMASPGPHPSKPMHGAMARLSMTQPESRGSMTLQSDDPFAAPLIDPNYLAEEIDMIRTRESVKVARDIFSQPAYAPFLGDVRIPDQGVKTDAQIDRYLRANVESDNHAAGTCRMGSDDLSVVDAQLRVHGMDNLRVVDASIMPRVVSGNTNAPVIMIAERAADFILNNGRCSSDS